LKELSLHILDVAENGISAGADRLEITIEEDRAGNRLVIVIKDNGRGIPPDILAGITDPFYTTRTTRRVGLGLSLLESAARRCGGLMTIDSAPEKGTWVTATFAHDHIDRAPLGDMGATLISLIAGNPDVDFIYRHIAGDRDFSIDTGEIRKAFDNKPVTDPEVFRYLMDIIGNI